MANSFCVVYITTPKGARAQKIARELVEARVAACVNIVPSVRSLYWWEGKVEAAGEALLVIKTQRSKLKKLMKVAKKIHPYSVPEIIALPIVAGHKPYLRWVKRETRA